MFPTFSSRGLAVLLAAAFLAAASPALAAIGAPVSLGGADSITTAELFQAVTTTADSPAGSAIVVMLNLSSTASGVGLIDSAGNTYTVPARLSSGSAGSAWIAYCLNCLHLPLGGTITASWTNSSRIVMTAGSISGLLSSAALDVAAAGSTTAGTSATQTSATLAQAIEIVIGRLDTANSPGTWTEASGLTTLAQQGSVSGGNYINWGYQIVASTSPVTYAPSWATSRTFQSYLYAFKGTSGGGGGGGSATGGRSLLGVGQ